MTIITILLSCGKKAITIHPELTGTWTGSDSGKSYELIISPNSTSSRFTISSSLMSYSKYTGTARIKDNYLKIDFLLKNHSINLLNS